MDVIACRALLNILGVRAHINIYKVGGGVLAGFAPFIHCCNAGCLHNSTGVWPSLFFMLRSAPHFTRQIIVSCRCFVHAKCNAVVPERLLWAFTSAPNASINCWQTSVMPAAAAARKAVRPFLSS